MDRNQRRHTGLLVRSLFEILLDHPQGLPMDAALNLCLGRLTNGKNPNAGEQLLRGCVAPIKAGWLVGDRISLSLSQEGKLAYQQYNDPEEFLLQAGKLSFKGWVSLNFPKPYFFLGKLRDQFEAEYRVAKRIGVRNLLEKAVGKPSGWQEILPLQAARRIRVPDVDLADLDSFLSDLTTDGLGSNLGGHAVYLPPQTLEGTSFRVLANYYPPNSGLKILKHRGGISESVYVSAREGESLLHLRLIHNLRHLTLVANLLHVNHLGPRLHDLVELECNGHLWTAFVVDHVGNPITSNADCEKGIKSIRDLERKGLVKVILPAGFEDEEFQCPDCSGNAFMTANGEFRYVDFQNFSLTGYGSFLKQTAIEAAEASHFGDKSIIRGGRYLYQSVPGVALPGKRNVEERMKVLRTLLDTAGVSVQDRLVLDIGCNIGMMMAQYLKLGALWCHGWDHASVVLHTERLLLALGCTRFSTSGAVIEKSRDLVQDLPAHLKPHLKGCVISYLAIRGHVGWLNALQTIPWSAMIYEGHEGETAEDLNQHLQELKKLTPFGIAAQGEYADGDSERRAVAILTRN